MSAPNPIPGGSRLQYVCIGCRAPTSIDEETRGLGGACPVCGQHDVFGPVEALPRGFDGHGNKGPALARPGADAGDHVGARHGGREAPRELLVSV